MNAGVVTLAVVVHLAVWLGSGGDPSLNEPLVDARTYHELAVGLARDGVLNEHFLWQAPFYPFFLALVYKVFGVSLTAVRVVQVLLAAATCALTLRLGRRVAGPGVGLLAGLMLAVTGPFVFFNLQLLATGWAAFWMVVLANLALDAFAEEASLRPAALLGVAGALAFLTRPTFAPVLLILGLILLLRRSGGWGISRTGLGRVAALGVGLIVVLVPYSATMIQLTGHDGLLPPSGGINLYIGNNPQFEETINIRVGLPWEELIAEPMRHGFGPGPWAGQPYFRGKVKAFIKDEPMAFGGLLGRKSLHLLNSRELPRNVDIYNHREWSPVLSALVWKAGPWAFPMGVILPLALVGWLLDRRPGSGALAGMALAYGAALVLVFVSARYRVAMLPLLVVAAAQGVFWLKAQAGRPGGRQGALAALVLVGSVTLAAYPGPFAQEQGDLHGELFYGVGWNHYQREDWEGAERYFRKAVGVAPDLAEAHNFLALVLTKREAWEEACTEFAAAVEIRPGYGEAERNLDRCRQRAVESRYRKARTLEEGSPAEALAVYESIFEERPDWVEVRVRLAWMLATSEDEGLRDRARARALLQDPSVLKLKGNAYIQEVKQAAGAGDPGR